MEAHSAAIVAIVAQDVHRPVCIIAGHWRISYLIIHPSPDWFKVCIALHAQRARHLPVLLHAIQALAMNCVAAGQDCSLSDTVKEVLKAYWTVLTHAVLHTDVVALDSVKAASFIAVTRT